MNKDTEKITHDVYGDGWECICGNQQHTDGFYTCDELGNEVEPTVEEWKTDLYACHYCFRIFDSNTFDVVGVAINPELLPN